MPITTIILNKNNDPNKTIESLNLINSEQILLGTFYPISTKQKNITTIEFPKTTDYNVALNKLLELVDTDWIFYIKDNEKIIDFNENISSLLLVDENYGVQILQDDILVKETRLWNKKANAFFKNPIFERLNIEPTKIIDMLIYQKKVEDKSEEIIDFWKKSQPFSVDACYYKAFSELSKRNFKSFKSLISSFLFKSNKKNIPDIMARYYLSLVDGLVDNNIKDSIQNIILCLAENPTMAEFWCLLGDIFIKMEKFEEAVVFYENAICLGSRRSKLDFWPMHISKYNDYPNQMIEKCQNILISTKTWAKKHQVH